MGKPPNTSADHIFPLLESLARRGLDGSIRYFAGRLQTQFGDMHVVPDLVVAKEIPIDLRQCLCVISTL